MSDLDGLPEDPEAITPTWLSRVLRQEVSSAEQKPLGDGIGFMGDILRLDIEGEKALSLVAKLPKKENRVMGEMMGVYEREIMFFRSFANEVPIRIPKLYFSAFDRDKGSENQDEIMRALDRAPRFLSQLISVVGRWVAAAKKRRYLLLIEYMDAFKPGDQLHGLSEQACIQVVEAIAPLHRKYWNNEAIQGHFWLMDLDIDARLRQGMYKKNVRSYQEALGPDFVGHLDWLVDHGETLNRQFFAQAPTTLLHNDLRLDNVLFSGTECAFIDFQLVRKGPAAQDIAYFITSAVAADAAPEVRDRILAAYHNALAIEDYTQASLKRDYQRAIMVILANMSGAADVELGNERGHNMMQAWLERLKACAAEIEPATLL